MRARARAMRRSPTRRSFATSATTGAGLDELRAALAARGARGPGARRRRSVPHARSIARSRCKGTGTVVTGTVWSGTLARDATVRALPARATSRACAASRPTAHAVDRVHAGERAAIALAGVERRPTCGRGAVLVAGRRVAPDDACCAPTSRCSTTRRHRSGRARGVRFHLGTSEVGARVVVATAALAPGEHVAARIVLDEPVVARAGDRFVLRARVAAATRSAAASSPIRYAPPRARPWPRAARSSRERSDRLLARSRARRASTSASSRSGSGVSAGASRRAASTRRGVWRVGRRACSRERARRARRGRAFVDAAPRTTPSIRSSRRAAAVAALASRARRTTSSTRVLDELVAAGEVALEQGVVALPEFAPTLTDAAATRSPSSCVGAARRGRRRAADASRSSRSRSGAADEVALGRSAARARGRARRRRAEPVLLRPRGRRSLSSALAAGMSGGRRVRARRASGVARALTQVSHPVSGVLRPRGLHDSRRARQASGGARNWPVTQWIAVSRVVS